MERYAMWGNKRPYLFVTLLTGALAGTYDIPLFNSDVDDEEISSKAIKDQNGNAYSQDSDHANTEAAMVTCVFKALKPEFIDVLIAMKREKFKIELLQEAEGRDGEHRDYWMNNPAVSGVPKHQGQGEFTFKFTGTLLYKTAV
ncbi:MAG: hypothetical protein ACRC0X_02135 [Brevinema sp.]